MTLTIAVIDCNRNGLAAIRSLGAYGAQIIAIDHHKRRAGQYSKYVKERHLITKPNQNEAGFVQDLIDISKNCKSEDPIYLLPVNDEYVRTLAANWERLSAHYIPLFETDVEQLDTITNKVNFSAFAKKIGIPQPERYTLEEVENSSVTYPIIFKPDERRSLENIRSKVFKVKLCHNDVEGKEFVAYLRTEGIEVIIQQFIPGGDDELYTGGVVALEGKLLGCFTGKKVRQYPPMAGQASWATSLESKKLVEYSNRIVSELGFSGLSQIEFKHWDGELYVIEMNPRAWSWHGLAKPSGVDLPAILIDSVINKPPAEIVVNSKNGIYWHFFLEDFFHNVFYNRNISFLECLRSIGRASSHAFYDSTDLVPWFVHIGIDYPVRVLKVILGRK
jgi:D-aspartate ligase